MGCCQSAEREASDDSPRIGHSISSTDDAASRPNEASRAVVSQPSRSGSHGDSATILPPPNVRPNLPVRAPTPLATSPAHVSHQPPPWTRTQLEREREAFFDTRVTGNDEVWKALRVVSELVRKDELLEAQGIIDALSLTCPKGKLSSGRSKSRHREKGGIYDERGQLYDIPAWVLTDPEDIVEDEEKDANGVAEDDEDSATAARRRDEKGKGRAEDPGETVQLSARLSDRGTDVIVTIGVKERISVIIRSIQEQTNAKRIRLMYLGKTLDERSTLEQSGWKQGHVVNALVFEGDESMLAKSKR